MPPEREISGDPPRAGTPLASLRALVEAAAERLLSLTRPRRFVVLLVVAYVAISARDLSHDRYLHDEGLITYLFSSYLSRAPVAMLFYLKIKPVLALLNLPGTLFGLGGFFVGHVLLGALGIVFVAGSARALGLREPGLPPLLVTFSPMYLAGGSAGISNVDGVMITAAAIWVLARPRAGVLAGLLLGILPWVRFELALFCAIAGLAVLWRDRSARFLVGLVAFPALYLAAGALYHEDALWLFHFRPVQADFRGLYPVDQEVEHLTTPHLLAGLLTVTPLLGALLIARPSRLDARERVGSFFVALYLGLMVGLPLLRVAFGYSERYFLQALPVAALLIARLFERVRDEGDQPLPARGWAALLTFFCLTLTLLPAGREAVAVLVALGVVLGFALLARSGLPRAGAVLSLAAAVAWPFLALPVDLSDPFTRARMYEASAWLRAHAVEARAHPVYTNLKLLDAYLRRSGALPGVEVRCFVQEDNLRELAEWTNPRNGQRDKVLELVRWRFYGVGAFPGDLVNGGAPAGSLLVLEDDPRLTLVGTDAFLAAHTTVLERTPQLTIAVLR